MNPRVTLHRSLAASLLATALFGLPATAQVASEAEPAQEVALPPARSIIDTYLQATGLAQVAARQQSRHTTGTVDIAGLGPAGDIVVFQARPARTLVIMTLPGIGEMRQGCNGKVAWSYIEMMGPQIKEGNELELALLDADFDSDLFPAERFEVFETVERTRFNGQDCYKLRSVYKPFTSEGTEDARADIEVRERFEYFSVDTGLRAGTTMKQLNGTDAIPVEVHYADYQRMGDLLVPMKVEQEAAMQRIVIKMKSVEINSVPEGTFDLPEEIRALLPEERATTESNG
jgi:hypothetical protein